MESVVRRQKPSPRNPSTYEDCHWCGGRYSDAIRWTPFEARTWVREKGHMEFLPVFKKMKVAGDTLLAMSPSMLDMFGITHSKARQRLLLDLAVLQRSCRIFQQTVFDKTTTNQASIFEQNTRGTTSSTPPKLTKDYLHKVMLDHNARSHSATVTNYNYGQPPHGSTNTDREELTLESQHRAWLKLQNQSNRTSHQGEKTFPQWSTRHRERADYNGNVTGVNVDDDDDDEENTAGFHVDNSYVAEKQQAFDCIASLADTLGAHFTPWMMKSIEVIQASRKTKLFVHEGIRKGSGAALIAVCGAVYIASQVPGVQNLPPLVQTLDLAVEVLLQCLEDFDNTVVLAGLSFLTQHLSIVGGRCFSSEAQLEKMNLAVLSVLSSEDADADDKDEEGYGAYDDEDDEFESELQVEVHDKAIDCVTALAKALGPQLFSRFLQGYLPVLQGFAKPSRHVSLRSTVVASIAEISETLGSLIIGFLKEIVSILLETIKDEEAEVSSNSAFALGQVCVAAGQETKAYVPAMLAALYQHCVARRFDTFAVSDNATGAVARILLSVPESGIPLQSVLPTLMRGLPLKEDFEENTIVYKCVNVVFRNHYAVARTELVTLLGAAVSALAHENQLVQETRTQIVELLNFLHQTQREDFESATATLHPDVQHVLRQC
eukprot:m.226070 g.226070  ORF g.226070 m.226070 type:complete len:661 (-) comp33482_c2_seq1:126-2108(-)